MERMEKKVKVKWEDVRRKTTIKDLRNKLGRLYRIQKDHERLMQTLLELNYERVRSAIDDKDQQVDSDLEASIALVEKQKESISKYYILETKRLYDFLETVRDKNVKMILTLRHIHFLNWKEIAEAVGMSVKRVKYLHEEFIIEG